jgi:glycerophosphoryl diester phosphodiesterase
MSRIIGHRGAAGLALENTIESFKRAFEAGVDIVELDVHVTKDGKFVVSHDPNLKRVSGSWVNIGSTDYAELKQVKLNNGESVPLLSTVLQLIKRSGRRVVVELKVNRELEAFCKLIDTYDEIIVAVASTSYAALGNVRALRPNARLYVVVRFNALEGLEQARRLKATGLDLNVWVLNPFIYWLARRRKLELMVYTVNWRFVQRFVQKIYPHADICTNVPHKFIRKAEAIEQTA